MRGFDHVAVPMQNTDAMLAFYRALGLEMNETPSVVSVYVGADQMINFHRPVLWQGPAFTLRAPAARPPCGDFCFVWEGTAESLTSTLDRVGAKVETGPVARTGGRRKNGSMHVCSRSRWEPARVHHLLVLLEDRLRDSTRADWERQEDPMVDRTRRHILKAGAAATVMAAAPRVFAQQTGQGGAAMSFYEKGHVRIHYQQTGSGFPLLLIAGGGLNSTISGLTSPFNAIEEFKGEYRCIASDLRNADAGQSSGPLEIDRPWDAYTDDHLGLMDHLGLEKFMVMGFCIGGPVHLEPAGAGA